MTPARRWPRRPARNWGSPPPHAHHIEARALELPASLSPVEAEREEARTTALSLEEWLRKMLYWKASGIGAWWVFYPSARDSATKFAAVSDETASIAIGPRRSMAVNRPRSARAAARRRRRRKETHSVVGEKMETPDVVTYALGGTCRAATSSAAFSGATNG